MPLLPAHPPATGRNPEHTHTPMWRKRTLAAARLTTAQPASDKRRNATSSSLDDAKQKVYRSKQHVRTPGNTKPAAGRTTCRMQCKADTMRKTASAPRQSGLAAQGGNQGEQSSAPVVQQRQ
eukprot:2923833-Alexandrium_andersonii.AAC.1